MSDIGLTIEERLDRIETCLGIGDSPTAQETREIRERQKAEINRMLFPYRVQKGSDEPNRSSWGDELNQALLDLHK